LRAPKPSFLLLRAARSRRFALPRLTRAPRGCGVAQLTLVGKIINVNDSATQILYRVDDGTGARAHALPCRERAEKREITHTRPRRVPRGADAAAARQARLS
jgi:hypothetical protein